VSAPVADRPALRVLPGGLGTGLPPSPAPSISARPEPPIGVIMAGRVVIGCEIGTRCTFFARLQPIRMEAPDPTLPPETVRVALAITLVGTNAAPRGVGPTARNGRPAEQEPPESTLLMAGLWHIEAWTSSVGLQPSEFEPATASRLSCALDFELQPGQALNLRLASGTGRCAIHLTGSIVP
jgi:hypothetical protein